MDEAFWLTQIVEPMLHHLHQQIKFCDRLLAHQYQPEIGLGHQKMPGLVHQLQLQSA